MNNQTHSGTVFKQNRGQIAVTPDELIVEGEHWHLADIESIWIVVEARKPGEGQSPSHIYDSVIQRKAWPVMLLFLTTILLVVLLRDSIFFLLAFVPAIAGVLYLMYLANKYPQEVYALRFRLKRANNLFSEYQPAFRWKDRPSAQRVIDAVRKTR